ncbi:FAD/NAD(P)-binding protein [Brachybacterium vulturis]|uniref:FAD/NAD(P)-binding protein n=1 Tax=Brachybacterium vulturis TaxID=2017484 RepID=UPI0037370990
MVGAGPKSLFALEALAARLDRADRAPAHADGSAPHTLELTVVDPTALPGTGAAYAPEQPHVLRLNVSAALLDGAAGDAFPSFPQWVNHAHPHLASSTYPPRAVVGEYLAQRWQRMLSRLDRHGRCRHLRARALAVEPERTGGWTITVRVAPQETAPYDDDDRSEQGMASATDDRLRAEEVLLASGHGVDHDDALAGRWSSPLPLVPAVLPVGGMLSISRVPPGSRVALRGGALTFLDAALALTEGRGAQFLSSPERPGTLLHHRSPHEPATLLPTTRQGLLLDAKPEPGTPFAAPRTGALDAAARRLRAFAPESPQVVRDMLHVLARAAASLLEDATGEDRPWLPLVEQTLSRGAEPDLPEGPGRAEEALRRSVAVARGARAPGPAWALGRAWARLYPQITTLLRGSALDVARWSELRAAARMLERFAFGPPVETAEKLVAMVGSGAVDLSWVDAGTAITAAGPRGIPRGAAGPDLVIDAVLAPPGLLHLTDPLARQLRGSIVSVPPSRRGAAVDLDGTALTAAGRRREGLALLGRPTEDHVIGHDTLDRHLHDEGEQWAARLAARLIPRTATRPGERASGGTR